MSESAKRDPCAEIVAIKYYDYFTQKCIRYINHIRLYQNIEILINKLKDKLNMMF